MRVRRWPCWTAAALPRPAESMAQDTCCRSQKSRMSPALLHAEYCCRSSSGHGLRARGASSPGMEDVLSCIQEIVPHIAIQGHEVEPPQPRPGYVLLCRPHVMCLTTPAHAFQPESQRKRMAYMVSYIAYQSAKVNCWSSDWGGQGRQLTWRAQHACHAPGCCLGSPW